MTGKFQNIFEKIPDINFFLKALLLFLLVFTLSFDVMLSADIGPFTFRLANLFALLIFVFVVSDRLLKGKLKFVVKTPIMLPALFFLLFAVLSLFQSRYFGKSIGYLAWYIFDLFVVYLGVINLLDNDPKLVKLGIKIHLFCGALIALFGLLQLFGTVSGIEGLLFSRAQWLLPGVPRISGFSYEPSYFAFFILEALAVAVVFWSRNVGPFSRMMLPLLSILVFALFLSTSRTGWAGLFVLYLYALITVTIGRNVRKKKFLWILGISALLFFCVFYLIVFFLPAEYSARLGMLFFNAFNLSEASSTAPRLAKIDEAFKVFLAHPLIGVGIGGYGGYVAEEMGVKGDPFQIVTSNMWVENLAEVGIFGVLSLLWLVFAFFWSMAGSKDRLTDPFWSAAVEAYKVSVLLIFLLAFQFTQTLYRMDVWFLLGMAASVKRIAGSKVKT